MARFVIVNFGEQILCKAETARGMNRKQAESNEILLFGWWGAVGLKEKP
jgi:hypothetical protein